MCGNPGWRNARHSSLEFVPVGFVFLVWLYEHILTLLLFLLLSLSVLLSYCLFLSPCVGIWCQSCSAFGPYITQYISIYHESSSQW